jgi:hypothetical protein
MSIPPAWLQALDFSGTPLVLDASVVSRSGPRARCLSADLVPHAPVRQTEGNQADASNTP